MKNKSILLLLIINLLFVSPLVFLGEEQTLDDLNNELQEAELKAKNESDIAQVQNEIENNKQKVLEFKEEVKQVQSEIDELEEKIPEYEAQAKNSLKVGQKLSNSNVGLKFVSNMLKDGNYLLYLSNKDTIGKLAGAIGDETTILFKKIDELKEKKSTLEKNLESLRNLEKQLIKQLDTLQEKEKKSIVSNTYQTSLEFYNNSCIAGQLYGSECGDDLKEVDNFKRPIKEGYVTNEFGGWDALDQDDGHTGIDLAQDEGMDGYREIYPSGYGQVIDVFSDSYGGIQVMMIHKKGGKNYVTNYAHLSSVDVLPGDILNVDDKIGTMGDTGVATGIHLHFEIIQGPYYKHSELENPRDYVKFPFLYLTFENDKEN